MARHSGGSSSAIPGALLDRELGGATLPAGLSVRAIEEGPDEYVLVLPQQARGASGELSDADLEHAAGGKRHLTPGEIELQDIIGNIEKTGEPHTFTPVEGPRSVS